jgi:predicted MFS family arabinose efflux permease
VAFGETIGLKAVWYAFPSFIGAVAALIINPIKKWWGIPLIVLLSMGIAEFLGPILQTMFVQLEPHAPGARMIGAALGLAALKTAARIIGRFNIEKDKL